MFEDVLGDKYSIEKKVGNSWEKCRMKELKIGDVMRYIEDRNLVFKVYSEPNKNPDGEWGLLGLPIEQ
jgi:hypothetical protein